jgi:hypothetical protein
MDIAQVTSHIQLFSSFLVAITGLFALIAAIVRPLNKWLVEKISHQSRYEKMEKYVDKISKQLDTYGNDHALEKAALIATLRKDLTDIYNESIAKGYVEEYDRKDFIEMYQVYSALGGNCYIHELHEKILEMPGKPMKKTRKNSRGK